eukprot:TRINITY_DN2467_c0_g3_i3.p1 TRINITY_DN2467_c0_g3~~TRINITY_DN2467_c0_g3_i3.p1  ORF type:complete len:409 (-),score=140.90 TRINITY_DN2467_c0_g3_i3:227-1453(-)
MNEHIERLEDETQRLKDYNKALENELESSKDFIEKMESEANSFEGDREIYQMEVKNAVQSLEAKEKRMQELEYALIEGKEKGEAMERELKARVQQLEKSLQSTMNEFNSLQKANENISSMLMARHKECNKLNNGTSLHCPLDLKRAKFEKAKMDELNTDLKEELEQLKEKLTKSKQELDDIKTTSPQMKLNRVVSQNLALNSMFMSEAEELKSGRKMSRVDNENEGETKKESTLETELMQFIKEETGETHEPSPVHSLPVFMDYKYDNQMHIEEKDSEEFGIQVNLLRHIPELISDTCIRLSIIKMYKRLEKGTVTETVKLLAFKAFEITIESIKPKTKPVSSITKLLDISIAGIAKSQDTPKKEGRAEDSTPKKSLIGSAQSVVRKKPLTTFDPLKSFFILVRFLFV